ncbi:hypothetical protein [Bradyrhizobium sp. AUGA SZCCT0182]|uniref:hypothetical protein n=1 Tax=Bradyrhizobium sp. AUGA SZCCT0182 TaxID=2807667 RepID=UPI001BA6727C|nr:hypothetical protein [Bradyrhizobium sp. AUGA SZCCT0182]MBR1235599.1 hypothetical protein [Bradyrhizobium sp. AUGA SZCCT0182]
MAQPYSITSSACASTVGGNVNPSCRAVLRFIANSTFCWLLNWQIGRLSSKQYLVHEGGCLPTVRSMYPWPHGDFDNVMDEALDIELDYFIRTDQAVNFRGTRRP